MVVQIVRGKLVRGGVRVVGGKRFFGCWDGTVSVSLLERERIFAGVSTLLERRERIFLQECRRRVIFSPPGRASLSLDFFSLQFVRHRDHAV